MNSNSQKTSKKFLGIHFQCCNMYARIYINKTGTAYEGRCPKCRKKVVIPIGKGGSSGRFFDAY